MSLHPPGSLADLPPGLRLFPLEGALLLPRAAMPLNIFEPRYLAMVTDAMATDQLVAMIQPRADTPSARPPLYDVGTVGRITQYSETGDGRFLITLTGLVRFRVARELTVTSAYRQAEADYSPYLSDWSPAAPLAAAARADLESTLRQFLDTQDLSADWDAVRSADDESLVNTLCAVCPFAAAERQALLEAPTLADRTSTLTTLMRFARSEGEDDTLQ